MSFKAKTVFNKDIRVFRFNVESMEKNFENVNNFVKEKYQIESDYVLQYEDDEKDMMTIASGDDFEDAFNQAQENKTTLKIFVVSKDKINDMKKEKEEKADEQQGKYGDDDFIDEMMDEFEQNQSGYNNNNNNNMKNEINNGNKELLMNDLIKNKEFRNEFINCIATFLVSIQEDKNKNMNEALQQALITHEQVAQHKTIQNLIPLFPMLLMKYQPYLAFLYNIDPEQVGGWINSMIDMQSGQSNNNNNNNGANIPPFIPMMVMPWLQSLLQGGGGGGGLNENGNANGGNNNNINNNNIPFGDGYGNPLANILQQFQGANQPNHYWNANHHNNEQSNNSSNELLNNDDFSVQIINDDSTLADNAYVLPAQMVVKTWRVKNDGKKDWPNGMKLKYIGEKFNPIVNGVEFNVPSLKINEERDVSIMIEIPKPDNNKLFGVQEAKWCLYLPNNQAIQNGFGFIIRLFVVNENENEQEEVMQSISQVKPNSEINEISMDNNNNNNNNNNENNEQPIMESNVNEMPNYPYQEQLTMIMEMGFDDVDKIKQLLNTHKGNMETVVNLLYA